jgi:hypothetical protein
MKTILIYGMLFVLLLAAATVFAASLRPIDAA